MTFAAKWILAAICASPVVLSAQSFTLEQALSAPFNAQLTAAPASDAFAWVANREGRRNLWVAVKHGSSYTATQLTHYSEDDGIELHHLAWLPNAASLLYTRGGDSEFSEKPSANPALLSGGVEEEIWQVPLQGGAPHKLADGGHPAVASAGDAVAFISKGQIWGLSLKEANAKPEQWLHTRGSISSLVWSPDGTALAFVSDRGSHSFIGVYTRQTKTLRYLDAGTDHDQEPVWSADGKSIAFIRIPFTRNEDIFGANRTGPPWSIRIADAQSGAGREVWRAGEGMGSVFHGVQAGPNLIWSGDSLFFPWERDGWLHLYSVPASGGSATLLTPGEFEVDSIAASKDGKHIVFSSNQDDIDRRHIWKLDAGKNLPVKVTDGEGIETAPAIASDNATIAILHSDARVPIRPAVIDANGKPLDLAPQAIPQDFPAAGFTVPRQVFFASADGLMLHGQLFLPANASDGHRHPALVFFHGGSRRQMLLGWHSMEYYSNAYGMNQYLASLGYIVLSVNYRSGIGYGEQFREALHYGPTGASEYNDVQGAGLYLRSRADVDPTHIGVWGGSYGGYLTGLALARASDMFAAGVDMHGVHDWNLEFGDGLPAYDPATDPNWARTAWTSSPLSSVSTWRSPVLLIQGDDDRNVAFSQTVQLAAALRKQNVECEELIFPDEIHDFLLHRDWLAAYKAEAAFFNKHLK